MQERVNAFIIKDSNKLKNLVNGRNVIHKRE